SPPSLALRLRERRRPHVRRIIPRLPALNLRHVSDLKPSDTRASRLPSWERVVDPSAMRIDRVRVLAEKYPSPRSSLRSKPPSPRGEEKRASFDSESIARRKTLTLPSLAIISASFPEQRMTSAPLLFDRAAVRRNLRRAQKLGPATFLIDRAAEDLCDRLSAVLRRFELAVDLASPTDAERRRLRGTDLATTIIAVSDPAAAPAPNEGFTIVADAQALPLREDSLDLVVSALALQFVD